MLYGPLSRAVADIIVCTIPFVRRSILKRSTSLADISRPAGFDVPSEPISTTAEPSSTSSGSDGGATDQGETDGVEGDDDVGDYQDHDGVATQQDDTAHGRALDKLGNHA